MDFSTKKFNYMAKNLVTFTPLSLCTPKVEHSSAITIKKAHFRAEGYLCKTYKTWGRPH